MRRKLNSSNQEQLLKLLVTGQRSAASYFSYSNFPSLFPPSTSHGWQQQDGSERQEGLLVMLLRSARKGAAGRLETHVGARRDHRRGFFCTAERPHDWATVPGEGVAERLAVWQPAHNPARRRPGWGLLHLPVQHTPGRAQELHHLPRYLWYSIQTLASLLSGRITSKWVSFISILEGEKDWSENGKNSWHIGKM